MGLSGTGASITKIIDLHIATFYAFTDGITEASNPAGEEFGMQRVVDSLKELRNKPIQSTIEALYDKVSVYTQIPTNRRHHDPWFRNDKC